MFYRYTYTKYVHLSWIIIISNIALFSSNNKFMVHSIEVLHGGHVACQEQYNIIPMGQNVHSNAKHFYCSWHATWPPCKTSIQAKEPYSTYQYIAFHLTSCKYVQHKHYSVLVAKLHVQSTACKFSSLFPLNMCALKNNYLSYYH